MNQPTQIEVLNAQWGFSRHIIQFLAIPRKRHEFQRWNYTEQTILINFLNMQSGDPKFGQTQYQKQYNVLIASLGSIARTISC